MSEIFFGFIRENNSVYIGEMTKSHVPHGFGLRIDRDKQHYGEWKDGKKHGIGWMKKFGWIEQFGYDLDTIGHWKEGKRHGTEYRAWIKFLTVYEYLEGKLENMVEDILSVPCKNQHGSIFNMDCKECLINNDDELIRKFASIRPSSCPLTKPMLDYAIEYCKIESNPTHILFDSCSNFGNVNLNIKENLSIKELFIMGENINKLITNYMSEILKSFLEEYPNGEFKYVDQLMVVKNAANVIPSVDSSRKEKEKIIPSDPSDPSMSMAVKDTNNKIFPA